MANGRSGEAGNCQIPLEQWDAMGQLLGGIAITFRHITAKGTNSQNEITNLQLMSCHLHLLLCWYIKPERMQGWLHRTVVGARRSSRVRVFTYGAMVCWINPSWWTHWAISRSSQSVRLWSNGLLDWSFMVDPLSYFSFQPVLHDWCNKSSSMCYPVCGMVHIK